MGAFLRPGLGLRHLASVAVAALFLLGATRQASAQGLPLAESGRSIAGSIGEPGVEASFVIDGTEGGVLTATVTGKNGLEPSITLAGPEADAILAEVAGKKKAKLVSVLPYTGSYLVTVSAGDSATTGAFAGKLKVKPPKGATKVKLPASAPSGGTVGFDAVEGMSLSGKVTLQDGEPGGVFFRIVGPNGDVDPSGVLTLKKEGKLAVLEPLVLDVTGAYRVEPLLPDDDIIVSLKLKAPKPPKDALAGGTSASATALAAPLVTAPSGTNATSIAIEGLAPGAAAVSVVAPTGAVVVPVQDGAFALDVALEADAINTLAFRALPYPFVGKPSAPRTIQVTMDTQPPGVSIVFPPAGLVTTNETIIVSGAVSDILSGTSGLTVTVGGQPAEVFAGIGTNGSFEVADLPLALGDNTLVAHAVDAWGNVREAQVVVERIAVPANSPKLVALSGDDQRGTVVTELPEPLVVRVQRADGTPFAGKVVTFRVSRSDGRLAASPGATPLPGSLTLSVTTDAQGEARAWWTLGVNAGSGNNRVEASSVDVAGTAYFCASAAPGAPVRIVAVDRTPQGARVGAPVPLPIRARVTDGTNPVGGVPVTFSLPFFDGLVDGYDDEAIAITGVDGIAEVSWVLGEQPGVQRLDATFGPDPGQSTSFLARALSAGPLSQTRFSGLVLDDSGFPIGGATITLVVNGEMLDPVESDEFGGFLFAPIEDGFAELTVDARQADTLAGDPIAAGTFPSLHYENLVVVPGADNGLQGPVVLPRMHPENQRSYSLTEPTVLGIDGIVGLRVIVEPGSMRLPDGTLAPEGTPISLDQVHFDDIPMPMPDGVFYPFSWTMQPGGSTFDPPVRIEMPNMTGSPPGAVLNFSSFNHATGRFDILGSGSVTEDGAFVVSDPGGGLSLAGWFVPMTPWGFPFIFSPLPPIPPQPPITVQPKCKPLGWDGYLKAGAKLFIDLALDLVSGDLKSAFDCAYNLAGLTDDFAAAFDEIKFDGVITASEAAAVTAVVKSSKTALVKCLELVKLPDPAGFAEKALKISNGIKTATSTALASDCIKSSTAGKLLAAVNLINDQVNNLLNLATKLSAKEVALVAACAIIDQVLDILNLIASGSSFAEDPIAQIEGLLVDLDAHVADIAAADAEVDAFLLGDPAWEQAAADLAEAEAEAEFDFATLAGCSVKVGSASALVSPGGGFELFPVEAGFGLAAADFVCGSPDGLLYGRSEYFFLESDVGLTGPIVLGPTPPPSPVDLWFAGSDTIAIEVGQTVPLSVMAEMSDGTVVAVDHLEDGTRILPTNPGALVDIEAPSVTGVTPGTYFLTALNNGLTVTMRVDVYDDLVPVTLAGFVSRADGTPVADASLTTALGGSATSGGDGSFELALSAPSSAPSVKLSATGVVDGEAAVASKLVTGLAFDGPTDAGILVLEPIPPCEPGWVPTFGSSPGVEGFGGSAVHASVVFDDGSGPSLFVGGEFLEAGGVDAKNIARWDGQRWWPLGGGLNGSVHALAAVDDPALGGPALFAGGTFSAADGVPVGRLARWDGSTWSPVGLGVNGNFVGTTPIVKALVVHDDGSGKALYVGGDFKNADQQLLTHPIVRWNGTSLDQVGSLFFAPSAVVNAFAVHDTGSGPELWVGRTSGNVLRWNGATFVQFGGLSTVEALTVHDDGTGPRLHAGHSSGVAAWTGSTWSPLGGSATGGPVRALASHDDGTGPALFAGGKFTSLGVAGTVNIARWKGGAWQSLGGAFDGLGVSTLTAFDPPQASAGLFAGGSFLTVDEAPYKGLARWDGSWKPVGSAPYAAGPMIVHDDGGGPALYVANVGAVDGLVAGSFLGGLDYAGGVGRWDGSSWSKVGDEPPGTTYFALGEFDGSLLASGYFPAPVGTFEQRWLMRLDGQHWTPLGGPFTGIDPLSSSQGPVAFVEWDDGLGGGPALYVGGNFQFANGLEVDGVARWDGSAWQPIGAGIAGGVVKDLVLHDDGSGPTLFAASQNRVWRWDGATWIQLGGSFVHPGYDGIAALASYDDGSGTGPVLYVAGSLDSAGGVAISNIARWVQDAWAALPGFFQGTVNGVDALAVHDDGQGGGPRLIVAGIFNSIQGQPMNGIAAWDGANWSNLGDGVGGDAQFELNGVDHVLSDSALFGTPALLISGTFPSLSGSGDSNLGRWGCPPPSFAANLAPPTHVAFAPQPLQVLPSRDLVVRRGQSLVLDRPGDVDVRRLVVEAGASLRLDHPRARLVVREADLQAGASFDWRSGSVVVRGGTWRQTDVLALGERGPGVLLLEDDAVVVAALVRVGSRGLLGGAGAVSAPVASTGVVAPLPASGADARAALPPVVVGPPSDDALLTFTDDFEQGSGATLAIGLPHVEDTVTRPALSVGRTAHVDGRIAVLGQADGHDCVRPVLVLEAATREGQPGLDVLCALPGSSGLVAEPGSGTLWWTPDLEDAAEVDAGLGRWPCDDASPCLGLSDAWEILETFAGGG